MEEAVIKRIMPNSPEAEEAVIGSMLLDQEAVVHASEKLVDTDFYHSRYRILFSSIIELYHQGRPVDLVTLVTNSTKKKLAKSYAVWNF